MQPSIPSTPPPPLRRALASPTQTRTAVLVGAVAPGDGAREGPKPRLNEPQGGAFAPSRASTRCDGACWWRGRQTRARARVRPRRRQPERAPSRTVAPARDLRGKSRQRILGAMLFSARARLDISPGKSCVNAVPRTPVRDRRGRSSRSPIEGQCFVAVLRSPLRNILVCAHRIYPLRYGSCTRFEKR
jgi:hypothetical protein